MSRELLKECQEDGIRWCVDLIKLNSENPPGKEIACARYCCDVLRSFGMEVKLDEFEPGRANVIACFGNRDDIGIVFNGHLDVVPAKGRWDDPPFEGRIHDGCIWGRGSADMKSGCAAVMAAAKYCIRSGWDFSRKGMVLTFVADEENVNKGSIRLSETWRLSADACIVAEPTGMAVHYGNRGFTSYYIRTRGKSCHACDPGQGENAIYKMAEVLQKLEKFAAQMAERRDPQLGVMTMSVGTIRGGTSLNMVPDFCEIEVEARVFPGTDAQSISGELRALLGEEAEVAVRSNLLASLVPEDSDIVKNAAICVKNATGQKAVIGKFPACSEASFFSVGYGIPTILLGPGNIQTAHKPNEFVPQKELCEAVQIYSDMIKLYCDNNMERREMS